MAWLFAMASKTFNKFAFFENRHFGVVNYAASHLAYPEVHKK